VLTNRVRRALCTASPGVGTFARGPDVVTSRPRAPANQQEELMNVRPLQDRLLVRRIEETEKTKGGIIIPDSAKERPLEGKVVSVGSGKRLDDGTLVALDVKAGDRILFGKYAGTEIKVDGVEHLILREDEVLGVID
jgi:chaperonin GroES